MRGGDYRLEVKIIQKFENKKKFKKKFKFFLKKIHKISFSLPTGTKGGAPRGRAL